MENHSCSSVSRATTLDLENNSMTEINLYKEGCVLRCAVCRADNVHIEKTTITKNNELYVDFWCEQGCRFTRKLFTHEGLTFFNEAYPLYPQL